MATPHDVHLEPCPILEIEAVLPQCILPVLDLCVAVPTTVAPVVAAATVQDGASASTLSFGMELGAKARRWSIILFAFTLAFLVPGFATTDKQSLGQLSTRRFSYA